MSANELRGDYWNGMQDEIVQWYVETKAWLKELLLSGGYPPFTHPLSPRDLYDKLVAMRDSGDPAYWNDPRAQAELNRLAARFGAPSLGAGGPYGAPSQAAPLATLRATNESLRLGPAPLDGGQP